MIIINRILCISSADVARLCNLVTASCDLFFGTRCQNSYVETMQVSHELHTLVDRLVGQHLEHIEPMLDATPSPPYDGPRQAVNTVPLSIAAHDGWCNRYVYYNLVFFYIDNGY